MATLQLQAQSILSSSSPSPSRRRIHASLHHPANLRTRQIPIRKLITGEKMRLVEEQTKTTHITQPNPERCNQDDNILVSKLYAIAEAAADRAEMHAIIGEQRNNWAHLLLNSVNSITLTASIMAGISSIPNMGAFKISSALLFTAATGMMAVTNKIQPSQLAEEQRNATRLFRQLEKSIHTTIKLRSFNESDVKEAMDRVLALDKAYPLPLLPGMLEKFPNIIEPTVWWPKLNRRQRRQRETGSEGNGWSKELEEEMVGVLRVVKRKDTEQYLSFGKLILGINRTLAVSGPLLAGLAVTGACLIGSPALGPWPALVGVVSGVLSTVVNTLEHGGQTGMVFELSRNCAGFYRQLEEEIETNLEEREVERRENGNLFEMKMALQLGRSLSELKGLSSYASPSCQDEDIPEFAGKLF